MEQNMHNAIHIHEHMEVIGADGSHVGVVDEIEGQTIRLTRSDPNAGGVHHWIPLEWVDLVDNVVHLSKPYDETTRRWQSAALPAAKS
jgi:hypothetical protein